ncbi:hypothetical protein J6590_062632 [Homalodisca vitripennis]|nr:hypothetical protein J6590_062632 [Homalodisca vitripennis]
MSSSSAAILYDRDLRATERGTLPETVPQLNSIRGKAACLVTRHFSETETPLAGLPVLEARVQAKQPQKQQLQLQLQLRSGDVIFLDYESHIN